MDNRIQDNIDKSGKLLVNALRSVTQKKFRQLADLIPTKILLTDNKGNLIYTNKEWLAFTGTKENETLGEGWINHIHKDDLQTFLLEFNSCLLSNAPFENECRLIGKDGEYRWHLNRAMPFIQSNGEVEYWIGISTDIEENKRLLLKLEEMNEFLEEKVSDRTQLLNEAEKIAKLGSWEWDVLNDKLTWSDSLCYIYGVPLDKKPKNFAEYTNLLSTKEKLTLQEGINYYSSLGKSYQFTHLLKRRDGTKRMLDSRGKMTFDKKGNLVRITGTTQDVTEIKEKEELLKKKNEELQRTNEELEQFAYIASHDLKEPLRMVSTYTQMLKTKFSDKLGSKGIEYVNFATEGALRMQELINDLLNYSRAGRHESHKETVDCNLLINYVLKNLESLIKEHQANIQVDDLPVVQALPSSLGQVFQNLIQNAIKFKGNKKPVIKITARKSGKFWKFCVKDNGIGINENFHDKIFMLFQRLHTRDKYDGTGIGLAICKKVIELHGGRLWVESAENKGSKFFFTIPIVL